jgi:hypothetical protein
MESHGAPNRIQVTGTTYELLRGDFILEPRGTISVKGKGELETWFLVGHRTDLGDVVASDDRRLPQPVCHGRGSDLMSE